MTEQNFNSNLPKVFIDGLVNTKLQGWAQKADSVVIYIEDNLVAEVPCNEYRKDLDGVLINANASFSYPLIDADIAKELSTDSILTVKFEFKLNNKVDHVAEIKIEASDLTTQIAAKADSNELDVTFYKKHYSDLKGLSTKELEVHWLSYGQAEGRYPNENMYFKHSPLMQFDFDLDFYTALYPDLSLANISDLNSAKLHWLYFGKEEKRYPTLKDWLMRHEYDGLTFNLDEFNYKNILLKNEQLSITFMDFLLAARGIINKPIRFYETDNENAVFYCQLGLSLYQQFKKNDDKNKRDNARNAWRVACFFEVSSEILVNIAKSYFEEGDFRTAEKVYEQILKLKQGLNLELLHFIPECYEKLNNIPGAIHFLNSYRTEHPNQSYIIEKIDILCQKLHSDNLGEMQVLANLNKRNELLTCASNYSNIIYKLYYEYYSLGCEVDKVPLKTNLNTERVLIIGDYHIPQCIRYRIDQKIEQLESQGKIVTTIDWADLQKHHNQIALHDIIIFYRVPAVPSILKAVAQVNANGKASFYEIDDLLFEESYPAPIDTFGGYVDLNTHINLRKSPANFASIAKLCRFGIASTELLREKLAKLVSSKTCLLHRNGLDRLNYFTGVKKASKDTIDIFYGSGTQAHNSDFTELALPALESILKQYSHARLIIAGYLELPQSFKQRFKKQLLMVPPVKSVKAYWNLLERADINLAVLNDDIVNGCKSELKWFEAACVGLPSVLSSTANYRDVINNGKDAFLVSTPNEWESALSSLVNDESLRHFIARNAFERVKVEYTVEALGKKLINDISYLLIKNEKSKKKIALVNVFFPPQAIGGATRVVSDNFDILQEKYGSDFELVVFTSDDRSTTPYLLETYQYQGVTVYRSTILHRENIDWHSKDKNMYDLFQEFLLLEKPDIVHFHCVQRLTASIVEAAKDNNVPYIVTAHDAWWISDHQFLIDKNDTVYPDGHPDIFAQRVLPNNVSLSESIERINYFKYLLSGAKKILTVSKSFADIYKLNGYANIIVNKNGISSTVKWLPKNTNYTDKIVCAHIGGMANHKGYFLLKEAIEQQQPNNIEMLIVDHSKVQGYENKTYWGKVPVTYIGRVSQRKVAELYQKIDVLFAPSLWPESYGLVTREAAASGCWVIASELGGIGEDIIENNTGFKLIPSLESLNFLINKLDSNCTQFKNNIEHFDIRSVDEQVAELKGIYLC